MIIGEEDAIRVGAHASFDDADSKKRFYTGKATMRDVGIPASSKIVEEALESAYKDAMSFTRGDLDKVADRKG